LNKYSAIAELINWSFYSFIIQEDDFFDSFCYFTRPVSLSYPYDTPDIRVLFQMDLRAPARGLDLQCQREIGAEKDKKINMPSVKVAVFFSVDKSYNLAPIMA